MDGIFKYFTLGNLAQTNSICGFSSIEHTDATSATGTTLSDPNLDILGQLKDSEISMECQ